MEVYAGGGVIDSREVINGVVGRKVEVEVDRVVELAGRVIDGMMRDDLEGASSSDRFMHVRTLEATMKVMKMAGELGLIGKQEKRDVLKEILDGVMG